MNQERIVTAQDILNEQEELEKEALEAMPYKFDVCSFEKGRLNQSVYVCLDCYKDETCTGGVCYSCSISCHGSHKLLELFNKRNFICECGTTQKYKTKCKLNDNKPALLKNDYNHNFKGLYCKCNTFYDPCDENVVMFQCYMCFDWFHEECIGDMIENYEDFICYDCVDRNSFLLNYYNNADIRIEPVSVETVTKDNEIKSNIHTTKKSNESNEIFSIPIEDKGITNNAITVAKDFEATNNLNIYAKDVTREKPNATSKDAELEKIEPEVVSSSTNLIKDDETTDLQEPLPLHKPFPADNEVHDNSENELQNKPQTYIQEIENLLNETPIKVCKNSRTYKTEKKYNVFGLNNEWSKILCKCEQCVALYKENKAEFLLSEEVYVPESDSIMGPYY